MENLFCLGSPLAVFLALRGLRPQDDVEDHVLPKSVCKRLLNVYHPADPVVRYYVLVLDLFWSQVKGFMFLYWCGLFRFEDKDDHEVACEQAFLFGRTKRVSRERARERLSLGPSTPHSRVLARVASLVQIGELTRRLTTRKKFNFKVFAYSQTFDTPESFIVPS